MSRPVLVMLYAPASRPDRVAKALAGEADGVIVDLEDAVAPSAKDEARQSLGFALADATGHAVQVRVNAVGTPWHDEDVRALGGLPAEVGARIPKAESVADVQDIAAALPGRELHLLVESALGVERAFELAQCPQVASIGLGEADLRADLRASTDAGLLWARGRVVNAAQAAGLPSPMMSAFTRIRDLDALDASCAEGRTLGFLGRTAIHPTQVPVIRRAFLPSDADVVRASRVLASIADAVQAGTGALQLADGTFLDLAMVTQARTTLALADLGKDFPPPTRGPGN